MSFPTPLARWRGSLALFAPVVADALAPFLDRIGRAIGPLDGSGATPSGEAAGYDGLSARGPYERLLASEWLLADEAPDEFIRRAAANEHVFLAVARESPKLARRSTVFVDVGPELFGAPRIAAFAALIVLEARARAARAEFEWQFAQGGANAPRGSVASMVHGRADRPPTDDDLGARVARAVESGEAWVVGGASAAAIGAARDASVVRVDDVLEPEARAVSLTVRVRNHAERHALLELPDDATCVRILRDPLLGSGRSAHVASKVRGAFAPARPSVGDRCIFARLADGGVVALQIPNSPRTQVGAGRVVYADDRAEIVAFGEGEKSLNAITQSNDVVSHIRAKGKRAGRITRRIGHAIDGLRPLPIDGRMTPLVMIGQSVAFIDRGGRLVEFRPGNRGREIARGCRALVQASGRTVYTRDGIDASDLGIVDVGGTFDEILACHTLAVSIDAPFFLGVDARGVALAAHEESRGVWVVATIDRAAVGATPTTVVTRLTPDGVGVPGADCLRYAAVDPSEQVVGLAASEQPYEPPHLLETRWPLLVTLDADRRVLSFVKPDGIRVRRVPLPAPVLHVDVNARAGVAACISEAHELLVIGVEDGALRARIASTGESVA